MQHLKLKKLKCIDLELGIVIIRKGIINYVNPVIISVFFWDSEQKNERLT
jgi:hypothetical protein